MYKIFQFNYDKHKVICNFSVYHT